MPRVAITDYTFPSLDIEKEILRPLGCEIDSGQCKTPQSLIPLVAEADAVITQFAPVNAEVVAAVRRARVIVRYGLGVDNVDLDTARQRGIPVCNVPDYCIDEVADHTLAFILAATRQLEPIDRSGAPLSYQDTGDAFDKFEFNLDRIFITYLPEWLPEAWISIGKFKHPVQLNPIFDSPVGDLVWDEAAHPEGIAGAYTWSDGWLDTLRVVAGESAVLELSNLDDASLFFTQVWAEQRLGAWWRLSGGVTYYNWVNLNPDGNTKLSAENNSGNAVIVVGSDPVADVIFASKFNILNTLVVLSFDAGDECAGVHPFQLVGEWFYNEGSFAPDRDSGYSLGAAYGSAIKSQQRGDWYAYYAWSEVPQESVFTPVAQDDYRRATNFRGHMFGLAWFPFNRTEARLSFLSDTPIIPINGSRETEWRGRLDVTVGF